MATTTNPLTELIPSRYRRHVYALAVLVALVYSIWQASEGDLKSFFAGLLAALVPLLAASNTPVPGPAEDVQDDSPDEGAFYDGHGA